MKCSWGLGIILSNRYQDDELLPVALEDVQMKPGVDWNGIEGKGTGSQRIAEFNDVGIGTKQT